MKTGNTITSQNFGTATILSFPSKDRVLVRFDATGNEYNIHRIAVYNGMFTDKIEKARLKDEALAAKKQVVVNRKMKPSVHGIGYMGVGEFNSRSPFYRTWKEMIRRCYSAKWHLRFPTYIGCTVDERWHNFQNFCADFPLIEGYEDWLKGGYCLDKDYKVFGNKHYSLATCKFLTHEENASEAQLRKAMIGAL